MGLTGSCLESSRLAIELAQQNPDKLCATVGLHPHSAKNFSPELMDTFREMAQQPIVRAIGECGLDHFRNISTPEQQRECFMAHLDWRENCKAPIPTPTGCFHRVY